jgi:soluble lytic murein transglycosylase-like protein
MTNIGKVLDRIEEIARKCNPGFEARPPKAAEARFVDLLSDPEKKKPNGTKAAAAVDDLRNLVSRRAEEHNLDEELIRALIQVESGWKSDAVSSKGAMGLMQLMPRTARALGVEDAFDPAQNIEGGVKYLAQLTDKYDGDVEMALAAYNAGPSRVDAAGKAPFPETERYVRNVMALYHRYREEE